MFRSKYLIISFLFFQISIYAQDSTQLRQQIVKLLYNEMRVDTTALPGFVVGVIDGDSTFKFGFGRANRHYPNRPDANMVFELGGLTHVFTATILAKLEKAGKIQLDKPINNYLAQNHQFEYGNFISIKQLLTHTSRLPKLPDNLGSEAHDIEQPYAAYSKQNLFDFLKSFNPDTILPTKYIFSHTNYALLECIIEDIENQSFKYYFEKTFTPPLSNRTFVGEKKDNNIIFAVGHDAIGNQAPLKQYAAFGAALGVNSCLDDLLIFMQSNLKDKFFEDLHKPEFETIIDANTKVAKGWHVTKQNKKTAVVLHSGTTRGFSAVMMFVPRTQTGVIILANAKINMNRIALLILKMLNQNWKK